MLIFEYCRSNPLIALQAVNVTILLAPMGCGPAAPLWRMVG